MWGKFGKPEWAQVVDTTHQAGTSPLLLPLCRYLITIGSFSSRLPSHLSLHIVSCISGTSAFIASSAKPGVLDSGASSYMTSITDKFHPLSFSNIILILILLMVHFSLYVGKEFFMPLIYA